MLPERRIPVHPDKVLHQEFLVPMGITQAELAGHVGVSPQRISALVRCRASVTPEMAWRLAQALGTSPEFWINL